MECYQAYEAVNCLMQDERPTKDQSGLLFKNDSIEYFINQCLTNEIKRAQKITSSLFID